MEKPEQAAAMTLRPRLSQTDPPGHVGGVTTGVGAGYPEECLFQVSAEAQRPPSLSLEREAIPPSPFSIAFGSFRVPYGQSFPGLLIAFT